MLTADLVRARRLRGELKLQPLDERGRSVALELALAYLGLADAHVGRTRDELDEAFGTVEAEPRDQRLCDGVRKLVEDRCTFDSAEALDPEALRRDLFLRASAARGEGSFDRATVVSAVAVERATAPEVIEAALYADLHGAQRLTSVEPISPERLVAGYDLAQAQAALLRAVRVTVELRGAQLSGAGGYRTLFRRMKFLRLLHRITPLPSLEAVEASAELDSAELSDVPPPPRRRRSARALRDEGEGYRVEIDGPYSLFDSVTKYGLQLALLLPALDACGAWKLEADLRWGKEREPLQLKLQSPRSDGEPAPAATDTVGEERLSDEVQALVDGIRALGGPWKVTAATKLLALPGVGLCVPDLKLTHFATKKTVWIEVLGYWSREAVWKRVELVEAGLKEPILFAVSAHLRVSEAALPDELPSALLVYKRVLSARAVMARIETLAERAPK